MSRGSDSFTYDQANRLKTATVGAISASYSYDGNGVRRSKTVSGTTTNYVFDTNRRLEALLDDGTNRYVWGLGISYGVSSTGTVSSMHGDALQSVRALTDGTGTLTDTISRDAFGVRGSVDGQSTQPFDFTRELRDAETGFIYLRSRMYDPLVGRLISRDSLAGHGARPQTQNRYAYALNNPLLRRDRSGRDALLDAGAGGGLADCPPGLCGAPAAGPPATPSTPAPASNSIGSGQPAPPGPAPSPTATSASCTLLCAALFGAPTVDRFGGVTVISNAGGVYGTIVSALGAEAITFGGGTIVSPGEVPRCSTLLAHELVHVNQQRGMGDALFLARYLLLLPSSGGHDAHPFEQNANSIAGLNPDATAPRGWVYPFAIGCP